MMKVEAVQPFIGQAYGCDRCATIAQQRTFQGSLPVVAICI